MRIETLEEKLTFLAGASAAWTVFFVFVNLNLELPSKLGKRKIDDLKNRVVSIVHGLFALFVSGYHIYRDNPALDEPATKIQHIILLTSCAYFIYDFFACAYYGLIDFGLVFHHVMCLLGLGSCEYYNSATIGLMGLFLAECSNFPMHARIVLRTLKMRYTKLYESAECMYIAAYIVARGIFITLLVIKSTPVTSVPILIRLPTVGLWVQSLYFIYEMTGIIKRKVKHYQERCNKNISMNWFDDNSKLVELSYYKSEGKDKIF